MNDVLQGLAPFALVVLAGFLLDWCAVYSGWKRIKPLTKVLAMLLLICFMLNQVGWQINDTAIFLLLFAQGFGLAGDIFLLFPPKWFLWGLGSFFVGHLFYLTLFIQKILESIQNVKFSFIMVIGIIAVLGAWTAILVGFYRVLNQHRDQKKLWIAIQVYGWMLSGMTVFAFLLILLLPGFETVYLFLPTGALLFMVSDCLLAYNRFVKPIPRGQLWVRISYHLAQFLLAVGFLIAK